MTNPNLSSLATDLPRRLRASARSLVASLTTACVVLAAPRPPQVARAGRPARDAGMSTAEYAVGTVAAVAFAAVLYKVVRSGAVQGALTSIIQGALGITL